MRRAIFSVCAALILLAGFTPSASAGVSEHESRSTVDWFIAGEGGYFSVNMRLFYEDNGSSVTLRKIRVWMPNVRPTEHADGYYFDEMFVRCNRPSGTDWFFSTSNKVLITDDALDYTVDPNNMNCAESNVVFGGIGIINQAPLAPDLNDDFGSGNNYLDND